MGVNIGLLMFVTKGILIVSAAARRVTVNVRFFNALAYKKMQIINKIRTSLKRR